MKVLVNVLARLIFSKACAVEGAQFSSHSVEGEIPLFALLFCELFSCACIAKRKAAKEFSRFNGRLLCESSFSSQRICTNALQSVSLPPVICSSEQIRESEPKRASALSSRHLALWLGGGCLRLEVGFSAARHLLLRADSGI